MIMRIAIIGAGISGITLARALAQKAHVRLFEKSRGVSGRMSTRYAAPFCFDHGADSFTVRTKEFEAFLNPYRDSGVVAEWSGKVIDFNLGKKVTQHLGLEARLVASPNMNSLCKKFAENVDIKLNTDLPHNAPLYYAQMQGCYALMIGFNRPWKHQWIAAKVIDSPIKWVSINSTKPGRNKNITSIVAYSCNNWADARIDEDIVGIQKILLEQFQQVTGIDCTHMDYISIHRWKYAIASETEKSGYYVDTVKGLGCVSDWSRTSGIEECWLSATGLAQDIIRSMA